MVTIDEKKTRLASQIRMLRKKKGWNQPDLAHHSGISLGGIRKIEQEKSWPEAETISALAGALQCSVDDLYDEQLSSSEVQLLKGKIWDLEQQVKGVSPVPGITELTEQEKGLIKLFKHNPELYSWVQAYIKGEPDFRGIALFLLSGDKSLLGEPIDIGGNPKVDVALKILRGFVKPGEKKAVGFSKG